MDFIDVHQANMSFQYSIKGMVLAQCRQVSMLPEEYQCIFVMNTPNCHEGFPVFKWLYCDYSGKLVPIGLIIIMFLIFAMFIAISSLADVCIVPNIATIAETLKMSDTLAGVTVLAFGNGAPDVFTALASKLLGLSQIFYTGIAGGCMFVTTAVAGMILLINPFKLEGWSLVRDIIFLLISYILLFSCFAVGVMDHILCCAFVAVYALFIVIVILGQWGSVRLVKLKMANREDDISTQEVIERHTSVYDKYPSLREHYKFTRASSLFEIIEKMHHPSAVPTVSQITEKKKTIWSQFFHIIKPFSIEDWRNMALHEKALVTLQAPVSVLLKLLVPVCNVQHATAGWSKLLVAINMLFIMPVSVYLTGKSEFILTNIFGMPLLIWLFIPSIILFGLVLIFTKVENHPKIFWVLSFIGFAESIIMVNFLCEIVVHLLEGFGTKMGISYSTLGMTLLAWGNSLGDLVSNTTLARNGMPKMGFAACFGAPLFTCIFGAGVSTMASLIKSHETKTLVYLGATGGLVSFFVFVSLIMSLTVLSLMNMDGRRSYGCFLLTLYLTFLIMVITAEISINQNSV